MFRKIVNKTKFSLNRVLMGVLVDRIMWKLPP